MLRERNGSESLSEFLRYLAQHEEAETQGLPALTALSGELGISVASLREQLNVARALGLVEVRPRTGMRRLPYSFLPAVRQSLAYALTRDRHHFETFANLRRHIEIAYWYEAAPSLTAEDHQKLRNLLTSAWEKLRGNPIQIPHEEHRELHLTIYRRLNNPFVMGLLEAYWEAYEAVGFNFYTDLNYLQEVWGYHQKMVESIGNQDFDAGYQALTEHTDLLHQLIASTPPTP
ncbi:MAG: hypothetical protein Fur0043_15860 [Anaerolineales bacterium]